MGLWKRWWTSGPDILIKVNEAKMVGGGWGNEKWGGGRSVALYKPLSLKVGGGGKDRVRERATKCGMKSRMTRRGRIILGAWIFHCRVLPVLEK
jgi:hypothetical protein